MRGAPILVASITSGDVQVGYTGGSATLGAVAGGIDFVNRVDVDLVVRPGIKTAEDLRGKRLGVQSIGGTSWMMAMLALTNTSSARWKPYTTLDAFNNIRRLMKVHNPKVAKLRPKDVVENCFVRKLDESGFIDRQQTVYGVK